MSVQETIERSHRTNGVFEVAVPQPGVSDEAAPGEADGAGATKTTTGTSRRSAAAPARARRRMPQALKRWGIRLFAILVAIVLWDYLTVTDFHYVMNFENVPEPMVVLLNFIDHIQTVFITQVVPVRVVGIMAAPYRIDVILFHHRYVSLH